MIDDRKFDSVACIPTKDYMKKPGEIYSLTISSYVIKHVNDWENKLPLKDLPTIEYDKEENVHCLGFCLISHRIYVFLSVIHCVLFSASLARIEELSYCNG